MRNLALDDLQLFERVAMLGTLSAVARERAVPVSQVLRSLTRIEAACGARLIHRSTQGVALTDEGTAFLDYCQRAAASLHDMEAEFASKAREPSGAVRVAANHSVAHYLLTPSLPGLLARHPQLQVDIRADDRLVDMAREGIDVALRSGNVQTDAVIAREIGSHTRYLYASPAYLAQHGTPDHPDALSAHRLITNSVAPHLNQWPFMIDGRKTLRLQQGQYRTDSTGIMMSMVLDGLGICRCNDLIARPLVREGRLVPVLEAFVDAQRFPIYAMMLRQRHRLPKIHACIAYWAEWFGAI